MPTTTPVCMAPVSVPPVSAPLVSMSHAPYGIYSSTISPGQYGSSASNASYSTHQSPEKIQEPVSARAFQTSPESLMVNQQTGESKILQPGFTRPDQSTKPETIVISDAIESQLCQMLGLSPNFVEMPTPGRIWPPDSSVKCIQRKSAKQVMCMDVGGKSYWTLLG